VRDPQAAASFVQESLAHSGRIDLLVNNAGVFELRPFEDTSLEFWQQTLDVNLTGAFIWARAVWPHIEGGQIINISSVAGLQAFENCAAYCASKFGLVGLSEALALEGRRRGIRVQVVCPGNTHTPIWAGQAPEAVQAKMMRPEDVAEVVRMLAVSAPAVTFGRLVVQPAQDPWK
jgi:NAD(P)-dependent dehydrogenase (short-subunit alcohol dehydrogenase family)